MVAERDRSRNLKRVCRQRTDYVVVAGTGDFNGDGMSDILWHDTSGNTAIWLMNGGTVSSNLFISNVPTVWSIQGAGAD